MKNARAKPRLAIQLEPLDDHLRALAADVRAGLGRTPKSLPCRYFYDDEGSRLFERICETPEYYLTRAERQILETRADEIAARMPVPVDLVELGSGSARKTRLVIDALVRRQGPLLYVPVDVSQAAISESADHLLRDFPALRMSAVAGEYRAGIRHLAGMRSRPKLVLYLGSNIGNLARDDAAAFLALVRSSLRPDDRLLVGVDRRKEQARLVAAYDDAGQVTAAFNRNILARINRELGADFDLGSFRHRATWDERRGCIDMHLVSRRAQIVRIESLGWEVAFREGEAVHTESSFKYSDEEVGFLARASGLTIAARWLDQDEQFTLVLLTPA